MKSVSMFAWGELVAATADSGSEVVFHECQTLNVLFFLFEKPTFLVSIAAFKQDHIHACN